MSTIRLDVSIEVEYNGDEQEALADVNDLVESLPTDYRGPVTSIAALGWVTA